MRDTLVIFRETIITAGEHVLYVSDDLNKIVVVISTDIFPVVLHIHKLFTNTTIEADEFGVTIPAEYASISH